MYEIVHMIPQNLREIARGCSEQHVASFSGGVPSAIMVEELIARHGRGNVLVWFADVLVEDPDLYRFVHQCMERWGGALYVYTQGKTPLGVAQAKKMIPCDFACPCSYELKVRPCRAMLAAMPTPPTIHIGLEAHETKRLANVRASYAEALPQVVVEYPLLWLQALRPMLQLCREVLGINPPRLYILGFKHNNCGGACVRQGLREWVRLLYFFPAVFALYEAWEAEQRAQGGPRAARSFCAVSRGGKKTQMPLSQIRAEYGARAREFLGIDKLTPEQQVEIDLLMKNAEMTQLAEECRAIIQDSEGRCVVW